MLSDETAFIFQLFQEELKGIRAELSIIRNDISSLKGAQTGTDAQIAKIHISEKEIIARENLHIQGKWALAIAVIGSIISICVQVLRKAEG